MSHGIIGSKKYLLLHFCYFSFSYFSTYIHEYVVGTSQLPVIALTILYMKQLNYKLKKWIERNQTHYQIYIST